jgi:NADH-quinone oxidoreductase subunit F
MELLQEITVQLDGRSFCGLGDAAAWPVAAAIRVFPEEFRFFIEHGRSIVDTPAAKALEPSWEDLASV